jgi:hypothetical protein
MTESNAGDFLEDERKHDPVERMVKLMETYLGPLIAKAKSRVETATNRTLPAPVRPLPPPIMYLGLCDKGFNVRVIENGFLLILSTPSPYSRTREVFCQDKAALIEKITQEIEAFVKASQEPIPPIHGVDAFTDDIATAS